MPEMRQANSQPSSSASQAASATPEPEKFPWEGFQRRIDRLTVAVVLMALVTLLSTAVVFGQLVNWFAGQALLVGGVSAGGALAGFGFGWFAGRRFG